MNKIITDFEDVKISKTLFSQNVIYLGFVLNKYTVSHYFLFFIDKDESRTNSNILVKISFRLNRNNLQDEIDYVKNNVMRTWDISRYSKSRLEFVETCFNSCKAQDSFYTEFIPTSLISNEEVITIELIQRFPDRNTIKVLLAMPVLEYLKISIIMSQFTMKLPINPTIFDLDIYKDFSIEYVDHIKPLGCYEYSKDKIVLLLDIGNDKNHIGVMVPTIYNGTYKKYDKVRFSMNYKNYITFIPNNGIYTKWIYNNEIKDVLIILYKDKEKIIFFIIKDFLDSYLIKPNNYFKGEING